MWRVAMGFNRFVTLGGDSGSTDGEAVVCAFFVGDSSVEESESELARLRRARGMFRRVFRDGRGVDLCE